jgi:hypothetical protein
MGRVSNDTILASPSRQVQRRRAPSIRIPVEESEVLLSPVGPCVDRAHPSDAHAGRGAVAARVIEYLPRHQAVQGRSRYSVEA